MANKIAKVLRNYFEGIDGGAIKEVINSGNIKKLLLSTGGDLEKTKDLLVTEIREYLFMDEEVE